MKRPKGRQGTSSTRDTITFQPTPEVRRLIDEAMGNLKKPKPKQTTLINDSLEIGIPELMKQMRQGGVTDFLQSGAGSPSGISKGQ